MQYQSKVWIHLNTCELLTGMVHTILGIGSSDKKRINTGPQVFVLGLKKIPKTKKGFYRLCLLEK